MIDGNYKKSLKNYFYTSLKELGLPTDFELHFRDHNKRIYGCYDMRDRKIFLYLYEDKECRILYPLSHLYTVIIHEAIHHYQYKHENGYKRKKGVMHNSSFKNKMWEVLLDATTKGQFNYRLPSKDNAVFDIIPDESGYSDVFFINLAIVD